MLTDVSEVRIASIIIALMIEAVRTFETSVNINLTTWYYFPENSKLYIRRRENLKSQFVFSWLVVISLLVFKFSQLIVSD
jgi:hypothetical protein